MSDTITMSRQAIELSFVMFAFVGAAFGFVVGRLYEMQPRKPRRPRRTPQERHTRSHW